MGGSITVKKGHKNPPCKDCEKRHVGCHSSCEDYIAYSENRAKQNARRFKDTSLYMDLAYVKKHGKAVRET